MKPLVIAAIGIFIALWSSELSSVRGIKIKWDDWEKWTDCDVTCGIGFSTRTRRCITPGVTEEKCTRIRIRKCTRKPCPKPATEIPRPEPTPLISEDMWNEWSIWSSCDVICGGGVRYRTRECIKPNGQSECETTQPGVCNSHVCSGPTPPPEPEAMYPNAEPTPTAEQVSWTPDKTPIGEPKPGPEPMPRTDDMWNEWSIWSLCDVICGGGVRYRTRECIKPNGQSECESTQSGVCNSHVCSGPTSPPEPEAMYPNDKTPIGEPAPGPEPMPRTDDMWNEWSIWSSCDVICGGGLRYRTRECIEPNGKSECEATQSGVCNTQVCSGPTPPPEPEAMYPNDKIPIGEPTPGPEPMPQIEFGMWTEWTDCSVLCGGGKRYRVRECVKLNGKTDCEDSEDGFCNTFECSSRDPMPSGEGIPMSSYSVPEGEPTGSPEPMPETDLPFPPKTPEWRAPKPFGEGIPMSSYLKPSGDGIPMNYLSVAAPEGEPTGGPEPMPDSPFPPMTPEVGGVLPETKNIDHIFPVSEGEPTPLTTKNIETTPTIPQMLSTYSTSTLRSKEMRKGEKRMKKICGASKIRVSPYGMRTAISPGFPKSYPGDLDCIWKIISPKRTRVSIEVESFTMDKKDKLTIYEGRSEVKGDMSYRNYKIATLTGTIENGTEYRSIGRFITVRLQTTSDSNGGKYSFKFGKTTTKVKDDEENINNPETSPEVEVWVKLLRILMKYF